MIYIEDINNLKINYSGNVKLKSDKYKLITGKGACTYSLSEFLVSKFSYSKQYHLIEIDLENDIQLEEAHFSNEEIEYLRLSVNIKYCLVNRRVISIDFKCSDQSIISKLSDFEFLIDVRFNF